ncbi:MAG: hypothetical protein EXS31_16620 [Pedosphaera sp.]|nr:hypothetical protein [Pedosphaera sp.]
MNPLTITILFVTAYLTVFLTAKMGGIISFLGTQIDLLPALIVYAGLTTSPIVIAGLAIWCGLLFDTLSANPLGITIHPLLVIGLAVHHRKELILRDQAYAQFILGAAASAASPLITALLLIATDHRPLIGWGSIWQLMIQTLAGGCCAPLCFQFFDRIHKAFNYQPAPESSFRQDREIKRGRA